MSNDTNDMNKLKEAITSAMREAAEPLIKQSLLDIERIMRARVAEIAVSMVKGDIRLSIDRFPDERRLTIEITDKASFK